MVENNSGQRKSALRAFGEHGPAWISAIAVLIGAITGGAGFLVGHATASAGASPQQTITVIKTIQGPAAPNVASSSTASAAAQANAVVNGTQLGTYPLDLTNFHSVPIGIQAPAQSQFNTTGIGDLSANGSYSVWAFLPLNNDKMVSLPGGQQPTYQACSTSEDFVDQTASNMAGTSFCLILTTGKLAGVYVTAQHSNYDSLQVTVWQYATS